VPCTVGSRCCLTTPCGADQRDDPGWSAVPDCRSALCQQQSFSTTCTTSLRQSGTTSVGHSARGLRQHGHARRHNGSQGDGSDIKWCADIDTHQGERDSISGVRKQEEEEEEADSRQQTASSKSSSYVADRFPTCDPNLPDQREAAVEMAVDERR
jgi:hypothetical protein